MVNIRDCITLKACRVIADIKAEEIAAAIDVNVDTLYNWEKGRSYPNAPQMVKILKLFAEKGYAIDVNDIKFF
jgi:DNA-binding transcriptional regulator YiaG